MKKILSIILSMLMIFGIFSGCNNDKEKVDNKIESNQYVNDDAKSDSNGNKMDWQLDILPITLTAYTDRCWFGDWDDPVAERVTQKTGVNLEIKVPVKDEESETISLMVASKDFPDLMFLNAGNNMIPSLCKGGYINNVDKLMESYAPKLIDILNNEFGKEMLEDFKYTDGNNYVLYYGYNTEKIKEELNNMNLLLPIWLPRFNVRKDYFDEIGNPDVTTSESFMTALEKIKGKHPDKLGILVSDISWFKTNFGVENYYIKNDIVKSNIRDPKYIEVLKFCNEMARKELLPKDGFMNPSDVMKSKFNSGEAIGIMANYNDNNLEIGDTGTTVLSLPPFKTYKYTIIPTPWMCSVVPKSNNEKRAIRFLEYCASKEGNLDMGYGVEGDNFGDMKNGPHYHFCSDVPSIFFPEGKPVLFDEFAKLQKEDVEASKQNTGVFKHNIMNNYGIYNWNIPNWKGPDINKKKYDEEMEPYVTYRPELNLKIDGKSELGVINNKLSKLLKDYEVKIIFEQDENKVEGLYNEFIERAEQIGLGKLEDKYTRQYQNNIKNK